VLLLLLLQSPMGLHAADFLVVSHLCVNIASVVFDLFVANCFLGAPLMDCKGTLAWWGLWLRKEQELNPFMSSLFVVSVWWLAIR